MTDNFHILFQCKAAGESPAEPAEGTSYLRPQLSILSCCGRHGIPLGCGASTESRWRHGRSPDLGGTLPHRSFWVTTFVFKVCWTPQMYILKITKAEAAVLSVASLSNQALLREGAPSAPRHPCYGNDTPVTLFTPTVAVNLSSTLTFSSCTVTHGCPWCSV